MAQSEVGMVHLFQDFTGVPNLLSETTDTTTIDGNFYAGGEGHEDTDAGIAKKGGTEANGVITITGANTDADTTFIGTDFIYKPSVCPGTAVFETRIQLPDLDTKEIAFGITSILTIDEQLEDIIINASATAVTVVADGAWFYLSDELTASATYWHGFSGGGTTADQNTAATNVLNTHAAATAANTWQILRLEVDQDGTCRWYIDGKLEQTVATAVAPTSLYAVVLACAANTTELVIADVDYILVKFGRDWTV